jgi:hypothetical protein
VLFIEDTMAKLLLLPHARHSKLLTKQKEVLVDREGWKVSMLKGMYNTKMPILI